MKTLTHVILPIAVLGAVIFGAAFMANYTGQKPNIIDPIRGKNGPQSADYRLLMYDYEPDFDPQRPRSSIKVRWLNDPQYAAEFELHGHHHHDFWFANPNPVPMQVGVRAKSCVCSALQMGVMSPGCAPDAMARQLRAAVAGGPSGAPLAGRLAVAAGRFALALGVGPLAALEQTRGFELRSMEPSSEEFITIPANDANSLNPPVGVVRFFFDGKEVGPKLLTARLVTKTEGTVPREVILEIPVLITPGAMMAPFDPSRPYVTGLDFGEVRPGTEHVREFYCISATRPDFTVKGVKLNGAPEPCLQIDSPQRLTPEECERLSADPGLALGRTRIRCAYRVTMRLRERAPGTDGTPPRQLDLGPIDRQLTVVTDATRADERDPVVLLRGIVRGEIMIIGSDGKEHIGLGTFNANEGTSQTVILKTLRPDVQLSWDKEQTVPSNLEVKLEPAGVPQQWKLRVSVPPKALAGALPPQSVVVVKTNDTPPRRVRIQVTGAAYNR